MPETSIEAELLLTCVQDLHAGCDTFRKRFPTMARQARHGELREELMRIIDRATERAGRLEVMENASGGPENLWMAGILDDAGRDTETIAPGPLLDIALIGAVRKGIVAELVSHETAIVLARRLAQGAILHALQDNRTQLGQIDDSLARLLEITAEANVSSQHP